MLDLFSAFGLPCSAAAAPCMLLSASSAWSTRPCALFPPQDSAKEDLSHAASHPAAGAAVTLVHFVTWLVQQAAVRRARAREHSAAQSGGGQRQDWPGVLPSLRIGGNRCTIFMRFVSRQMFFVMLWRLSLWKHQEHSSGLDLSSESWHLPCLPCLSSVLSARNDIGRLGCIGLSPGQEGFWQSRKVMMTAGVGCLQG